MDAKGVSGDEQCRRDESRLRGRRLFEGPRPVFTDGDISVDGGASFTQDVQKVYGTAGSTLEVNLVWRWKEHNPDLDWSDVVIAVTAKVQGEDVAVKCQNGIFVGVRDSVSGVVAFKSVPYAKPPTKETGLRWKPPVKPEDSDAVIPARHFGPAAAQTRSSGEIASCGPVSEDCLKLSIWTADGFTTESKRSVMFYIHGGSYSSGGMCDPVYDGERLVKDNPGVILVSCDYRVNTPLNDPRLAQEDGPVQPLGDGEDARRQAELLV